MAILSRMRRYFSTDRLSEHLISQWVMTVMIAVHWGLGVAILVGGERRFSIPTYEPLIDMTNGNVWIWGLFSCLAALFMMVPLKWPSCLGLWLGMAWMIVWTALFSMSIVDNPGAAATPAVAYAGFSMINAALLTARVIEKPRDWDRED